jgi:hypothetical protein
MEAPSLGSLNGRLYVAWRGTNDEHNLKIMSSVDNGLTFGNKYVSRETSDAAPGLAVHNGRLYITWRGHGNERMNVAVVDTSGNNITGFSQKRELGGDKTEEGPTIASLNGRLYVAWRGTNDEHNLNIMSSTDNGLSFAKKCISKEESDAAPALTVHSGGLYISWRGRSNDQLNFSKYSGR